MIAKIVYVETLHGWRCLIHTFQEGDGVAHFVGAGDGSTKEEAVTEALSYAAQALAAVKAGASKTHISYKETTINDDCRWWCSLLSDCREHDGIGICHMVGYGWGKDHTSALGDALSFAERALSAARAAVRWVEVTTETEINLKVIE